MPHWHYPASRLLRASPPPHAAQPIRHRSLVGGHAPPPHGASRVPSISSSMHADAITPTEPLDVVAVSASGDGLPQSPDGSASATCLFGAYSTFTRVSACMFARSPEVTVTQSTSTNSLPPSSPWLLPAERPIGRVEFASTGDRQLSRHTGNPAPCFPRRVSRTACKAEVGKSLS